MSDTLERVRGILARRQNLSVDAIAEDARLADFGIDSLSALELVFDIEEEFRIAVPDERLPEFTSLRSACAVIESLRNSPASN